MEGAPVEDKRSATRGIAGGPTSGATIDAFERSALASSPGGAQYGATPHPQGRMYQFVRRLAVVTAALSAAVPPLVAQHHDHGGPGGFATRAPRLGRIEFPTSVNGAAQREFVDGVLYLHSFEYDSAAAAFRRAQRIAPRFAMAYWGEAMTYTHPVWNQQDTSAGRGALRRLAPTREARTALAATPRERAYLNAVETLYAFGSKASRDTAYSRAMARVAAAYPTDVEAQAFFSLSLLGLNQGDRDVAAYMRAAAIVAPIFAAHPMHPGAAHYLIHAYDDPAHALLGLPAARAYSGIAPSAPHAQHMTSHIFLALGMWDETVKANEIATTMRDSAGTTLRRSCGHYAEWLQYAYLQQGRPREAARLLAECRVQATGSARLRFSLALMRAVQIAESGDEGGQAAGLMVDTAGLRPLGRALIAIGRAQAAARRGDAAALRAARAELSAAIGLTGAAWPGYGEISLRMLDGLLARAAGDTAAALLSLRRAAAIEDSLPVDFGPPPAVTPAHEVLGETLLRFGRASESRVELERQLARTPRRAATLVALARAATATGDLARAASAYEELAAISRNAEPAAPVRAELQRAKRR